MCKRMRKKLKIKFACVYRRCPRWDTGSAPHSRTTCWRSMTRGDGGSPWTTLSSPVFRNAGSALFTSVADPGSGMEKIRIRDPGQTSRRIRNTVFYTPGTFIHCSFHDKGRYESIFIEYEHPGFLISPYTQEPFFRRSKVQKNILKIKSLLSHKNVIFSFIGHYEGLLSCRRENLMLLNMRKYNSFFV